MGLIISQGVSNFNILSGTSSQLGVNSLFYFMFLLPVPLSLFSLALQVFLFLHMCLRVCLSVSRRLRRDHSHSWRIPSIPCHRFQKIAQSKLLVIAFLRLYILEHTTRIIWRAASPEENSGLICQWSFFSLKKLSWEKVTDQQNISCVYVFDVRYIEPTTIRGWLKLEPAWIKINTNGQWVACDISTNPTRSDSCYNRVVFVR